VPAPERAHSAQRPARSLPPARFPSIYTLVRHCDEVWRRSRQHVPWLAKANKASLGRNCPRARTPICAQKQAFGRAKQDGAARIGLY
jgi:hypothetical protein